MIIGTPGRIKDCIEKRYTVLNQCFYIILDEGDIMIDLGFEEDVNAILDAVAVKMKGDTEEVVETQIMAMKQGGDKLMYRITQMYSATMPPALEKLAKKYLRCPVMLLVGKPGTGKKEIEQRVELLSGHAKKYVRFCLTCAVDSD